MTPAFVPHELVRDVDLLCLDAGNTIVFLDHEATARLATRAGFALDPAALERAEGEAKRRLDRGPEHLAPPLPDPEIQRGWGVFVRTMVQLAGGLDDAASAACTRALWREHRVFNLWRRVPDGLIDAITALRQTGVRVCVVSNSEGRLHVLFEQLGIAGAFDLLIDSHVLGVEKPDPAIFHHALKHFGVPTSRALHLGDVVATDIAGARAAGLRAALIDPSDHYAGQHPDVPRVPGVSAVARAVIAARR
jgi:putative hydrolase of the HAD superfamily